MTVWWCGTVWYGMTYDWIYGMSMRCDLWNEMWYDSIWFDDYMIELFETFNIWHLKLFDDQCDQWWTVIYNFMIHDSKWYNLNQMMTIHDLRWSMKNDHWRCEPLWTIQIQNKIIIDHWHLLFWWFDLDFISDGKRVIITTISSSMNININAGLQDEAMQQFEFARVH